MELSSWLAARQKPVHDEEEYQAEGVDAVASRMITVDDGTRRLQQPMSCTTVVCMIFAMLW